MGSSWDLNNFEFPSKHSGSRTFEQFFGLKFCQSCFTHQQKREVPDKIAMWCWQQPTKIWERCKGEVLAVSWLSEKAKRKLWMNNVSACVSSGEGKKVQQWKTTVSPCFMKENCQGLTLPLTPLDFDVRRQCSRCGFWFWARRDVCTACPADRGTDDVEVKAVKPAVATMRKIMWPNRRSCDFSHGKERQRWWTCMGLHRHNSGYKR